MKLIFAIINKDDTENVITSLNQAGYMATRLSSSGGFLRKGNTTLMIGCEDEAVECATQIIKKVCGKRKTIDVAVPYMSTCSPGCNLPPYYDASVTRQVEVGGAIIFVTNIDHYEKI